MDLITSRQNPKIKLARSLRRRRHRERSGLFLVEGIRHIGEALAAEAPVEFILHAPDLLTSDFAGGLLHRAAGRGIPCYAATPQVFEAVAGKDRPQGVIAVLHQRPVPLESLTPEGFSWGVALIAPQDPGNVGAILRTMDAVQADGMVLLDGGTDPWHPTAVRASMGALFWVPVAQASFQTFTDWCRNGGYHVYGTSAHGDQNHTEVACQPPAILLLGSERQGLNAQQSAICERLVRLPMEGHVSSLNLAVAAGVMLYEMRDKFKG